MVGGKYLDQIIFNIFIYFIAIFLTGDFRLSPITCKTQILIMYWPVSEDGSINRLSSPISLLYDNCFKLNIADRTFILIFSTNSDVAFTMDMIHS